MLTCNCDCTKFSFNSFLTKHNPGHYEASTINQCFSVYTIMTLCLGLWIQRSLSNCFENNNNQTINYEFQTFVYLRELSCKYLVKELCRKWHPIIARLIIFICQRNTQVIVYGIKRIHYHRSRVTSERF